MIKKQLWCQNSKVLLSIFLLLSSVYITAMKEEDISQESYAGEPVSLLERVYADAPPRINTIVAHLQGESAISRPGFRSAFFMGEPGTGKTTLAKAIAYKTGRELKFFSATQFLGDQRNGTALNLQGDLEDIVFTEQPVVVVIDEINRLLENSNSKNHDTDTSAAALWTFLDSQYGNHNFFLIGTMNRIHKLPKPIKSRIMARCVKLNPVVDSNKKVEFFLYHLLSSGYCLHEELSKSFLLNMLGKLPPLPPRYLGELALAVSFAYEEDVDVDSMKIKKNHIQQALENLKEMYVSLRYDEEDETDEEMRERHHKESLKQQDLHFVQQQKIQLAIQKNILVRSSHDSYQTVSKEGIKEVESHLSDEQIRVYQVAMQGGRGAAAYQAFLRAEEERRKDDECTIL